MRHVLRSLSIYLFAVALVFNGGAFRVLANTAAAHPQHVVVTSVDADHKDRHEVRHSAVQDGMTIVFDHVTGHDHVNGSAKCCTMCIAFDNLTPVFLATATLFQYQAVVFKVGQQRLAGHLVVLDPDIPKTIV